MNRAKILFTLAGVALLACLPANAQTPYPGLAPSPLPGLEYGRDIYPAGADHDPVVPSPDDHLGFPVGQRTATPEQVVAYARAVAEASPRVRLVEYGRSYEGRPLVYLVISSPANLARTDEIKAGMQALADPRGTRAPERARLMPEFQAGSRQRPRSRTPTRAGPVLRP